MIKKRFLLLRILANLGAVVPLVWMLIAYYSGGLGANPIQTLEQKSGDVAIILLILTLACSPLISIFGWQGAPVVRRILGLYTFIYAAFHMLVFIWLDFGLSWALLRDEFLYRPFILLGAIALILLLLLAITTLAPLKRALGGYWIWLQRLIYVAALLAAFHFILARKGNILILQGDIALPLTAICIILFLLLLRIPFINKNMAKAWQHVLGWRKKHN